jgi:UPF0755 protein
LDIRDNTKISHFKPFWILLILFLMTMGIVGGQYWAVYYATPVHIESESMLLEVKQGTGFHALIHVLHQQGLIEADHRAIILGHLFLQPQDLKSGVYEIHQGMSLQTVLLNIHQGTVKQFFFRIKEGETVKNLLAALQSAPYLRHHLDSSLTPMALASALKLIEPNAEGLFFPDTYQYVSTDTDVSLLQKAYHLLQLKLAKAWEARVAWAPYRQPYEMLTMASIIEKETGLYEERYEISGVFARRLKQKMRLQSDPTVIYGLGEYYTGNLHKKDLQKDTPYNSYTREGLPPTPIAFSSWASMEAAAHPLEGKHLYFVSMGNGQHYFSNTLEEHHDAVAKYQLPVQTSSVKAVPPSSVSNTPHQK